MSEEIKHNFKYFKEDELTCTCCGRFNPNPRFQKLMEMVDELRERVGVPLVVASGYRCEKHPIEAAKIKAGKKAGQHTIAAIDLHCYYKHAYKVLIEAAKMGFTGIGVNQTGALGQRYIHLDIREEEPLPRVWSY